MIFVSQALAVKTASLLPMPLLLGILCAAGFHTGILPKDMIVTANMIAVGTIAFNVLVVHSDTMIDPALIRQNRADALICAAAALLLIPAVGFGLRPFIGRNLALLAPGAVIGGGASCAIASRWVLDKDPSVSVFPWMVFMFQGLFSVPLVSIALKKEAEAMLNDVRAGKTALPDGAPPKPPQRPALCGRLPAPYKTTAYYIGAVMLAAIANKYLQTLLPAQWGVNPNLTALLIGFLLMRAGLLEKGPLHRSDSYGLLLLGLMGLFANTIANSSAGNLLRLFPPLLLVFAVSTAVLAAAGVAAAKICRFRPWRGIALTMNCVMGFPVNRMLVENAAKAAANERERAYLTAQLSPLLNIGTMLIGNALSIAIVSVLVGAI